MNWDYNEAFKRNLGLINPEEQEILRKSCVAIAGMGGVGGIDLVTLARLGIGHFTIADPDEFEVANFNRQYGATVSSLGRSKVEVMEKIVKDINPEVEVRVFNSLLTPENADEFLKDADLLIDGIDAFVIDIRRVLYRKAKERGIYTINAGPIGFSASYLIFDPLGMSFDEYFDMNDKMEDMEKFARFILGVAPKATHRSYMDFKYVDIRSHVGPSAGLACQLCAGVVGAAAVKILLKRGPLYPVPYFHQFDAYLNRLERGYLWLGNRHPLQKLKLMFFRGQLKKLLSKKAAPSG